MDDKYYIDDQTLGVFIDEEMDAATRETIIRCMETDIDLRDRVYRLRRAHDLMKLGFGDAQAPSRKSLRSQFQWSLFSSNMAAAIAGIVVGFGAGMLGQNLLINATSPEPVLAITQDEQQRLNKIIIHVSQSDREQFVRALDYTKQFLREHAAKGHKIEVVGHATGLDLMRDDVSPVREQIINLIERYGNVHFMACASSIDMLRSKGIDPPIIRGVSTDSSAFEHIIERLQGDDWIYMKAESLPEI